MAKQDSAYRLEARPMLTSEEVVELVGVTRRTLMTLRELGIVEPKRFEERNGVFGWTMSQVETIRLASELRSRGLPFEALAGKISEKGARQATAELAMQSAATSRRHLKRLLLSQRQAEDVEGPGEQTAPYLRYIPQRWIALCGLHEEAVPGSNTGVRTTSSLIELSEAVGWCATMLEGSLLCPGPGTGRSAAFVELAAQPVPVPIGGAHPDGGCYRAFGGSCPHGLDGSCCQLCSRGHSDLSGLARIRWGELSTSIDLEFPPSTFDHRIHSLSPWSRQILESVAQDSYSPVACRPYLMPLETPLMPGAGAAVLPAGFYLCLQTAPEDRIPSLERMRSWAAMIPKRQLTAQTEQEEIDQLSDRLKENGTYQQLFHGSECVSPLTGLPTVAAPELEGSWQPVEPQDMHRLCISSGTGLLPQDDYPIVFSRYPNEDANAPLRYELQILLHPDSNALGALMKKKKKKKKLLMGLLPERKRSGGTIRVHCLECGANFEDGVEKRTHCCPHCGAALPAAESDNKICASLCRKAIDALADGCWDDASARCRQALLECPDEPLAHWLALLARYEVRWVPGSGGTRTPVLGRSGNESLVTDEDYVALADTASDETWVFYMRAAAKIEAARQNG